MIDQLTIALHHILYTMQQRHTLSSRILMLIAIILLCNACTISYKFNGASIDYSKVKTISVADFTNNAALVYPPLAVNLTDGIKDLYQRQTRLEQVRRGSHYN